MNTQWIEEGLKKPGKTRVGLAKALRRAPSMVTALLRGERQLKASEVAAIARYLDLTPPTTIMPPSAYESDSPALSRLEVVGEVAAGVWSEAESDSFEKYSVEVPLDARFPEADQFLLKVRGTSINRKAASGSLLRCLRLHAAPRRPKNDDWVIALRMRNGSAETTVKRLEALPDGAQILWPDSTDAVFQDPIRVGKHDGDEVQIVAFVLDFINPATRF